MTIFGIPPEVLADLGLTGLVTLTVLMILTGKLVPKANLDRQVQETDYWRTTANKSKETNLKLATSLQELTEAARLSEHVMSAIQAKNQELEKEKKREGEE